MGYFCHARVVSVLKMTMASIQRSDPRGLAIHRTTRQGATLLASSWPEDRSGFLNKRVVNTLLATDRGIAVVIVYRVCIEGLISVCSLNPLGMYGVFKVDSPCNSRHCRWGMTGAM